jgi:NADH dehydrogenase/NADH:ubiquinone oxidoreductase subunit G
LELLLEATAGPETRSPLPQISRSAELLRQSKRPVILVGVSFLTYPDNAFLLKLLERLIAQVHAELILLPEKVNLRGALQIGITNSLAATELQDLEVLHLIGEAIPHGLPSQAFVLYQNISSSASAISSGLVLPAAAFTEEDGTIIDHAGEVHTIRKVVQAPGGALPSWQILCRIARKLNVPGFDFENETQIRAEMESMDFASTEFTDSAMSVFSSASALFPASHADDHAYMGFPLRTWVAGLQTLYPAPAVKIEE